MPLVKKKSLSVYAEVAQGFEGLQAERTRLTQFLKNSAVTLSVLQEEVIELHQLRARAENAVIGLSLLLDEDLLTTPLMDNAPVPEPNPSLT